MIDFYIVKRNVTKNPLVDYQLHGIVPGAGSPAVAKYWRGSSSRRIRGKVRQSVEMRIKE